jgi:hypothetical protein
VPSPALLLPTGNTQDLLTAEGREYRGTLVAAARRRRCSMPKTSV